MGGRNGYDSKRKIKREKEEESEIAFIATWRDNVSVTFEAPFDKLNSAASRTNGRDRSRLPEPKP